MKRRAYKSAGKSRLKPFPHVSTGVQATWFKTNRSAASKTMQSDQVRGVELFPGDMTVACQPSSISAYYSTAGVFARNALAAEVRRVGSFIRMLGVPANLPHESDSVLMRFEETCPAFTCNLCEPGSPVERQSHAHPHAIKSYSTDPPSRLRQHEAR